MPGGVCVCVWLVGEAVWECGSDGTRGGAVGGTRGVCKCGVYCSIPVLTKHHSFSNILRSIFRTAMTFMTTEVYTDN